MKKIQLSPPMPSSYLNEQPPSIVEILSQNGIRPLHLYHGYLHLQSNPLPGLE